MNGEESRRFPVKFSGFSPPESSGDLTRKAGIHGSLGGGDHLGVFKVCLTHGIRAQT